VTAKRQSLYCPEDGAFVRVPLPGRRRLVGCHDGGWVVSSAPAPLTIVNIFSGTEVKLGEKQGELVRGNQLVVLDSILKIVFSEPPTSGDCILAVMTDQYGIGLTRVGCPESGWTIHGSSGMGLVDIVFCNNELYGIRKYRGELVKFEIGRNKDGAPVVTAECRLALKSINAQNRCRQNANYIFDLHGKLAMARTEWSLNFEPSFKVFKLVDIHDGKMTQQYKHKWVKMTKFG
jgi:hypothetical protein